MLDQKGFDQWAGKYDEHILEGSDEYPFEGYYDVLAYVHSLIEFPVEKQILDVGIGTGLLSYLLYKKGSKIWGIDFSQKMVEEAQRKIPTGKFYCHDLKDGVPSELNDQKFDYIISSYTLHHFKDYEKITLIKEFRKLLTETGKIVIADIGFPNKKELEACRNQYPDKWDESEHYFVADQLIAEVLNEGCRCSYHQVSSCGGVLLISFDKNELKMDENVEMTLFPR